MNLTRLNVLMRCRLYALMIAAVSATAFADDPIKYAGTATAIDKASIDDITNIAKWGDKTTPLSSESDYAIDGGKFCGFGNETSFPGNSLSLGVVDGTTGNLQCYGSGRLTLGTVYLNNGRLYSSTVSIKPTICGNFTVNASSGAPYLIDNKGMSGSVTTVEGTMHGSGCLRVRKTSSQTSEYTSFKFICNMSDFTGKIEVGDPSRAYGISYRTPVMFGDVSSGGEIAVNPCGTIGACGAGNYLGEFSVARLTFAEGATYRVSYDGTTCSTIRVTSAITLPPSGKVHIDVVSMPRSCLAGTRSPILVVPAGSGISPGNFDVDAIKNRTSEMLGKVSTCSLEVDKSSPDCEVLYLVIDKYTCQRKQGEWGDSPWMQEYSDYWYDYPANTPLDSETTYITYNLKMLTPGGTSLFTFPGRRIVYSRTYSTANYNSSIHINGAKSRVDDLVMMYGSQMLFWSNQSPEIYGNLTLTNAYTDGFALSMFNGRNFTATVGMNILGAAGLRVVGSNGRSANDNPASTFIFSGNNSGFSGKLYVTSTENDPATNTTLRISAANQVGGAMSAFTFDGVKFDHWSRFRADATLDFNEPTRGVYFLGGNYVNVYAAANTLTLSTQTTLAGTLVKEGAGTLALGGTLKFTSAQSDTPVEGTNILRVAAGRIRPASKTGADGLAISFAAGTGLRLAPLTETDADVVRYGLYDVKWATPFDLTATDGKLDVALDLPSDRLEIPPAFSFGVCTVSATAAAGIDADSDIVLPSIKGYDLVVSAVPNGDDTVTFTAKYAKRGFILMVE